MGIGNLYDDGNVLGETREVQLAADLIHPRGGKGGGTLWTKTKEGSFTLESSRIQERDFFFFPPCCLSVIIIILITTLHTS